MLLYIYLLLLLDFYELGYKLPVKQTYCAQIYATHFSDIY